MKQKDYFIKSGYVPNKYLQTMDEVSQSVYWDEKKIHSAHFHQFYVYVYLVSLVRKYDLSSLIDVGCGVATKLQYVHSMLPQLSITGIDQRSPIKFCKKRYRFGTWLVDDFEHPRADLQELTADLVVCSDVIEHVLDPDKLLHYLKGKMKKDGFLLISTPERDLLRGKDCDYSPNRNHIREWNSQELTSYLESHGFSIIAHRLEYPVKIGANRVFVMSFLKWVRKHIGTGYSYKYNQVFLLKKVSD
jgi:SAM-dependent methyltransferase